MLGSDSVPRHRTDEEDEMAMVCPVDGAPLHLTERQGVEIDYCQTCRGVWLDRGELDKILERGAQLAGPAAAPPPPPPPPPPSYGDQRHHGDQRQYGDDRRYGDSRYGGYQKKRRKSFLDDLFDFD